jgi:hypothetical protein
MRGIAPKITITTQQGNSNCAPLGEASLVTLDRFMLRKMVCCRGKVAQTPFRVALNAGDSHLRQAVGGGSNQIKGRVGFINALARSDGVSKGDGASGNQHYVYDYSVYIKYKRLIAKNKLYDDPSFGGANNGSYVPLMAVRRR